MHKELTPHSQPPSHENLASAWGNGGTLYREIVEGMADGIAVFDLEARLLYANPAAGQHFMLPVAQLLEKVYWQVHPELVGGKLHLAFGRVAAGARHETVLSQFHEPEERYFESNLLLAGTRIIITFHDITHLKDNELLVAHDRLQGERLRAEQQLSAQLEAANQALAASNQELDQFAYATSHDLKAPLRGITNLAGWIEEDLGDAATPSVRQQLAMLQGRARRLEALIEGILAYSRAGRVFEQARLVDIGALVADVIELVAPPSGVEVEIVGRMPSIVAERVPLQQIFMNLIQNAITHGCNGGGRVSISCEDEDLNYRFSVKDRGPGIAPEYHERIFGIFQTLAPRDKVEGAGIGLSVVKKLIESRGGTIRLVSAPEQGCVFSYTWPKQARTERH